MQLGTLVLVASVILSAGYSYASEIHCKSPDVIERSTINEDSYVIVYSVDGSLSKDQARLRIVGWEYGFINRSGQWKINPQDRRNIYYDIDKRSPFTFVKKNGKYAVYSTDFQSDRTGVMQYNLKFILNTIAVKPGQYQAFYQKTSATDDVPYTEKIDLFCRMFK